MPTHSLVCTCGEPGHEVLVLQPEAILSVPHRGTPIRQTFAELVEYIRRPIVREKKDQNGGLSLGRFRDGVRRLSHFEGTSLIGLDYDDGKLTAEQLHHALGTSEHVVYPTFSSTPEKPKARAILTMDRSVDLATHKRIMWVMYARAGERGFVLDPACKDATRWWFCPIVHTSRQDHYTVHVSERGSAPLRVDALLLFADMLDAAHKKRQEEWAKDHPSAPVEAIGKPAYVRAALGKAADKVRMASEGGRHEVLNAEAYSLARLDVTEHDIASVLVPAFVSVAGPEREREARRTVTDACKARGK